MLHRATKSAFLRNSLAELSARDDLLLIAFKWLKNDMLVSISAPHALIYAPYKITLTIFAVPAGAIQTKHVIFVINLLCALCGRLWAIWNVYFSSGLIKCERNTCFPPFVCVLSLFLLGIFLCISTFNSSRISSELERAKQTLEHPPVGSIYSKRSLCVVHLKY